MREKTLLKREKRGKDKAAVVEVNFSSTWAKAFIMTKTTACCPVSFGWLVTLLCFILWSGWVQQSIPSWAIIFMTTRTVQKGRCHLLREECDYWQDICHLQSSYPRSSRKSDALVQWQIATCILGWCLLPSCQVSWSQFYFKTLDLIIKYFPPEI